MSRLEKRADKGIMPYNLRNCAYLEEFTKPKIVYQTLARTGNAFQFDDNGYYLPNSCYIITSETINLKYLMTFLNSKTMLYYLDTNFSKLDNTGWQWILSSVEKLPVPKITESNQNLANEIISLVEQILESKAKDSTTDTKELEFQIDSLVYTLYNLTDEEIQTIKDNND